jgi:hypothetical protein
MAFDPASDSWKEPCDLCGNVRYETIVLPNSARALRCQECGLVTVVSDRGTNGSRQNGHAEKRLVFSSLGEILEETRSERVRSMLLIGMSPLPSAGEIARAGCHITALVEPGTEAPSGGKLVVHTTSLASAPFLPDQFDLIVCARSLESLPSPSLLFEKSRLWLTAGGILMVGGVNRGSLSARIWRKPWLKAHIPGAEHLLDSDNVKGYADRYGYEVKALRMRSTRTQVAGLAYGNHISAASRAMVAPVALLANLLNMGDCFTAVLIKGGAAVRPLPSIIGKEEERAAGLAPALYTGTQRKGG